MYIVLFRFELIVWSNFDKCYRSVLGEFGIDRHLLDIVNDRLDDLDFFDNIIDWLSDRLECLSGAWTIFDDEFEYEIAVSWNLADSEVLNFSLSVLAKHLVSPKIPHLDELISSGNDTEVFELELKVIVGMLSPVDDQGDGVSTGDSGGIDLRASPELVLA